MNAGITLQKNQFWKCLQDWYNQNSKILDQEISNYKGKHTDFTYTWKKLHSNGQWVKRED